jgi:hypothetical protein
MVLESISEQNVTDDRFQVKVTQSERTEMENPILKLCVYMCIVITLFSQRMVHLEAENSRGSQFIISENPFL